MNRELTNGEAITAITASVYVFILVCSVAYAVCEGVGPDDRNGRRIRSGVAIWRFLWGVIWPFRLLLAIVHFGKWVVGSSFDFIRFYLPERKVKVPRAKVIK